MKLMETSVTTIIVFEQLWHKWCHSLWTWWCSLSVPLYLQVIFKNKASRPYSFHFQGVYDRSQAAGIAQTHASSAPPGSPGDPVPPGEARTYNWRITKKQGPTDSEFDCKAGAYYSTVDKVCTGSRLQPLRFMDSQHVHAECPSVQCVYIFYIFMSTFIDDTVTDFSNTWFIFNVYFTLFRSETFTQVLLVHWWFVSPASSRLV